MKYRPVRGSTIKEKDAQVIGDSLATIREEHGKVTPRLVVDDATPDDAPLHPFFEWDNDSAADKYRLTQAQKIIRSVTVSHVSNGEPITVRAFTHVRYDDDSEDDADEVENGTLTVQASGADIWASSDEFHYVYQPLTGDAEIRGRVRDGEEWHEPVIAVWKEGGTEVMDAGCSCGGRPASTSTASATISRANRSAASTGPRPRGEGEHGRGTGPGPLEQPRGDQCAVGRRERGGERSYPRAPANHGDHLGGVGRLR